MAADLKKIKDLVEIVVKKIGGMEVQQGIMADQVRVVRDQQSVMNDKLDGHTEGLIKIEARIDTVEDKLDSHTGSLVGIEHTLKGYGDMYKVNQEKTGDLDERVTVIEDHLGLASSK
ncbi:MAG: hypothetical protein ACD_57C00356G0005 [uncultured bacterium]|nr:MAG: hypothetical protein ACD_57C00356G0005 [uncultured bacterium]